MPKRFARLYLVAFEDISGEDLVFLEEEGRSIFQVKTDWLPSLPLPRRGYHRWRGQYLAGVLLEELLRLDIPAGSKLVGITGVDIYAPGLNFVFGQALMPGTVGVISLARLRPGFYGREENESLFQERAVKEMVHELGHCCGLGHCSNRPCVMRFSNSISDTDIKGKDFCPSCEAALEAGEG
jgi:archaemetzincin